MGKPCRAHQRTTPAPPSPPLRPPPPKALRRRAPVGSTRAKALLTSLPLVRAFSSNKSRPGRTCGTSLLCWVSAELTARPIGLHKVPSASASVLMALSRGRSGPPGDFQAGAPHMALPCVFDAASRGTGTLASSSCRNVSGMETPWGSKRPKLPNMYGDEHACSVADTRNSSPGGSGMNMGSELSLTGSPMALWPPRAGLE
mmetsp:Transcript_103999/g.232225  ORF Transcript_103999/g.232225 Transcript_103999/m.232225 type:complete len:201 (+) Transcript_103999:744-1346(+)